MTAMARPALLYFLLWLGVMDLEKRIVEGQTCPDADRLYHVRLIAKEIPEWESHCSGSLISDQWVLTAAHCVEPGQTMTAYVNIHPGGEKEEIEVTQHEIYEEKDIDHNIMLVKLKAKPKKIHKIDLPTAADCAKDIEMSKKFQIAGHGLSAVDKDIKKYLEAESKKLQCLDMPVVDCNPVKKVMAEQDPVEPYDHVFCAQVKDKEPSPGDSGGGALYNKKIYGVFISCHETTPFKEPCRFMRVCKYLKWIEKTTKSP